MKIEISIDGVSLSARERAAFLLGVSENNTTFTTRVHDDLSEIYDAGRTCGESQYVDEYPRLSAGLRSVIKALNAAHDIQTSTAAREAAAVCVRQLMLEFVDEIGTYVHDNDELAEFDSVFRECGWDTYGLRFDLRTANSVYLVAFRDMCRTSWDAAELC
jgi:hypothetical protein